MSGSVRRVVPEEAGAPPPSGTVLQRRCCPGTILGTRRSIAGRDSEGCSVKSKISLSCSRSSLW